MPDQVPCSPPIQCQCPQTHCLCLGLSPLQVPAHWQTDWPHWPSDVLDSHPDFKPP